jgi:hypothetical protein
VQIWALDAAHARGPLTVPALAARGGCRSGSGAVAGVSVARWRRTRHPGHWRAPWSALAGRWCGLPAGTHRHRHLPVEVWARLDAEDSARSRRTALLLRQRLGRWERVRSDLEALHGADRELAETARADLLAWLQHGAGSAYGRPTSDQAQDIARYLATPRLTDEQRRGVAFVAGLPHP